MQTSDAATTRTVRLSFDISLQLRKRIRLAAVREDMTLTEFLTRVVSEAVEPEEKNG